MKTGTIPYQIYALREQFDELFPKDQEAIDGKRPSKSNRSAGLVLWAEWQLILRNALQVVDQRIIDSKKETSEKKLLKRMTEKYGHMGCEEELIHDERKGNVRYNQAVYDAHIIIQDMLKSLH